MADLTLILKPALKPRKVLIELDAQKLEKLAANFGFFSEDFLESLEEAENDCKAGRIKKIKSLRALR